MRIALVSSPRTGNNWVRRVIGESVGFAHFAEHAIEDFPDPLPDACLINAHLLHNRRSIEYLEERGCRIAVLARHPLDVFVSALQFARIEPSVHKWLDGACEIPRQANGLTPNDPRFVEWMTGSGAKALLSVTLDWWRYQGTCLRMKYEEFVEQPRRTFAGVIDALGLTITGDLPGALEQYSVSYFSQFNNHGWLGRPGCYADFITRENCERVKAAHKDYFDVLGYEIGDVAVTSNAARQSYLDLLPQNQAAPAQ